MDTEQLLKQLQKWDRLMYLALGSAITLVAASFNHLLGVVWFVVQILVTSTGFFLLCGKRWKTLPLSKERVKTIYGYLIASWFSLIVPWILGATIEYGLFLLGYTVLLGIIYRQTQKKLSDSDEMFP